MTKLKLEIWEWIKSIAIALVLVFVMRAFLFAPYMVDGVSMQPNFYNEERVVVNKVIYRLKQPERGEVIVLHVPSKGEDFIKRVIGVAGDTIKVSGDDVYVNGTRIKEPYIQEELDKSHKENLLYNTLDFPDKEYPDGKVPKDCVFVMGDNRPNSTDSRMIGYVPLHDVIGRAEVIFWPLSQAQFVKNGG
jgi:signal peptidase I